MMTEATVANQHDLRGKTIVPVSRDELFSLLKRVCGVIEASQVLQILSYVRLTVSGNVLTLTGTDSEVEISSSLELDKPYDDVDIAISGKKLFDICRNLPEKAQLRLIVDEDWATLQTQAGYFTLGLLSSDSFPSIELGEVIGEVGLKQAQLSSLIKKTQFSMAVQDIRYYLNGMCLTFEGKSLDSLTTDGHRLAKHSEPVEGGQSLQVVVPRKAVLELTRQLDSEDDEVTMSFTDQHLRVATSTFTLVTSLINVKYPDCSHLLVIDAKDEAVVEVAKLRQVLSCSAAILTQEKFKAARFNFIPGCLTVSSSNINQEKTEESLGISYQGEKRCFAFNIDYVRDVLSAIDSSHVRVLMAGDDQGVIFKPEADDSASVYMIMPLTL